MSVYTAVTDSDREQMLAAIGVETIDELFDAIPASLRLDRPLDIAAGKGELETLTHLTELASRNVSLDEHVSFLGAGYYDHYVPSLVDHAITRSEFLTPYTPYQPEVSQGNLQVMFEYQTAISELTGLPVSNASVYDGPSAAAAAGYLAKLANKRPKFLVSGTLHPHTLETIRTHAVGYGMEVDEVPGIDGRSDLDGLLERLDDTVSAVFLAQPNFLGVVEDPSAVTAKAVEVGAIPICSADPISLALLKTPADLGFEITVGEGQALGNHPQFGGPSFGFFAAQEKYLRRMPGRIAGETVDVDGRRGFVLTLQTREQHIRREKATSNICTSQALNALAGLIYLGWLGKEGMVELATLIAQRTAYARSQLLELDGVSDPTNGAPVVREFPISVPGSAVEIRRYCLERGFDPGLPLTESHPELGESLLVSVTERRTPEQIDKLAELLAEAVAAVVSTSAVGAGA